MIRQKRQNVESWNLDTTLQVYKASYMPILGVENHVIMIWRPKTEKKRLFLSRNFFVLLLTKKNKKKR